MIHKTDALFWRLDVVFEGKKMDAECRSMLPYRKRERIFFDLTLYVLGVSWICYKLWQCLAGVKLLYLELTGRLSSLFTFTYAYGFHRKFAPFSSNVFIYFGHKYFKPILPPYTNHWQSALQWNNSMEKEVFAFYVKPPLFDLLSA